jgi:hypothetical protein
MQTQDECAPSGFVTGFEEDIATGEPKRMRYDHDLLNRTGKENGP